MNIFYIQPIYPIYYILFVLLFSFQSPAYSRTSPSDLAHWKKEIFSCTIEKLKANISPPGTLKGTIVASPSKENPNYFYHWVRDAALVIETLRELRDDHHHLSFLHLSKYHQSQTGDNGETLMGEPKFEVDGKPFKGPWGRPQNDGPATRSLTLAIWALSLNDYSFIKNEIFPIVEKDLQYTSEVLWDKDFDLWEESFGHHIYTKIIQYKAFYVGQLLAIYLGRSDIWYNYQQKIEELELFIQRFWDNENNYFRVTIEQENSLNKNSGLDSSTLFSMIYFSDLNHRFLKSSLFIDRMVSTATAIIETFKKIYPINQYIQNQSLSPAIGRYPEDLYNGYHNHGEGNPWFISTLALAEFCHFLINLHESQGFIEINHLTHRFWSLFTPIEYQGQKYQITKDNIKKFLFLQNELQKFSDGFIRRAKFHSDQPQCSLSEQINRYSGHMQGARDLTWSYAALLRVLVRFH